MATVVVSGAIANKLQSGGEAWVRLSWVLGLQRLGLDVHFVEQIDPSTCVGADGRPAAFGESANREYFLAVMDEFGLSGRATLVCADSRESAGTGFDDLADLIGAADLLVNISGHLTLEPLASRAARRAYVDLDPGFTQFWHADPAIDFELAPHDLYFTVGGNIGAPDCPIPTAGIEWRHVLPPVVLGDWPVSEGDHDRFTTVGSWRGPFGPIEHGGRRYGLKVHEFRRFVALPQQVPVTFEVALAIDPADAADLDALRSHGWRVVNPREVAAGPAAFRRYVQGSGAEFSVAQGIYVETNSGWFSDRTVRYLASGKPALVQDTGFSRDLPAGEGLLAFSTLDEAAEGARRIAADYEHHARMARAVAEEHFESGRVLERFLRECGLTAA